MAFWKWKKSKKKKAIPKPKNTKPINQSTLQSDVLPDAPKPSKPPRPERKELQKKIKLPKDPKKEFLSIFKRLTHCHREWTIWEDFIVMFACALSNPVDKSHYDEREKRYLKIISKYNKQEQNLFPELVTQTVMALEQNPEQDFLGDIYTELELMDHSKKQEFTPYSVCQCMAGIISDNIITQVKKDGYITIYDPCCGAGANLIAGIHEARKQLEKANLKFQKHVLVVAQDIDEIVALMCYIQLSLLGVAAYVKVGNSLTEPMNADDTLDNYWFTMMYFSDIWVMRRTFHKMDEILKDG